MVQDQDISPCCVIRVFLLGPLEVLKRGADGTWRPIEKKQWRDSKPARRVFKRLLAQPGRRLSRGRLQDEIWPDTDGELADKYLYTAISIIHGIIGKELVRTWEASYELAEQSMIWTDMDACEQLLKVVENQDHTTPHVLPLLEQALTYLERGEYLEREEGAWCYNFRTKAEDMLKQCQYWLAEAYEAQGKYWQAGEQYRTLCQSIPPDENALNAWMAMLARQGKTQDALKCYQNIKCSVEAQGFTLSNELERTVASLSKQPSLAPVSLFSSFGSILGKEMSHSLGATNMDTLRRTITQSLLGMATATVIVPYNLDLLERFASALSKPSRLDNVVLCELEGHTSSYWQHRSQGTFPSAVLLENAHTHFSLLVQLLQGSLTLSERQRLCAIGSEVTQIIGMLLFDLRRYGEARAYFYTAIRAAQEADQPLLEAVAWGHLSFAWIYDEKPQEALPCIQKARMLALTLKDVPLMIQAELAAIEAETFACLGDSNACKRALGDAESGAIPTMSATQYFGMHFDTARWAGYQGACFRRLTQHERLNTPLLLQQAEQALQVALQQVFPSQLRRRSTLELDLAEIFFHQEEFDGALTHALQAALITERTGSQMISQRLRAFRQNIGERHSVLTQELDHQLARLVLSSKSA